MRCVKMGNKTAKVKQIAKTERKSGRLSHEVKNETVNEDRNDSRTHKVKSSDGRATESVESWSKPNLDFLLRKNVTETDPLQNVFDKIKRERNMDVNRASDLYTSPAEKYLVKLITKGHMIPEKIFMLHVLDKFCGTRAHMINEDYGCCCSFILTRNEFLLHDFNQCNSFHRLNADLICYQGKVFYLIDNLSNPFGSWNPRDMLEDREDVQKVYDTILQRWPIYHIFESDMSKFISVSERYLIKLINTGHDIPRDIITHVVDGCNIKAHVIDAKYCCCYGFILTRTEYMSHEEAKKHVKSGQEHIGRVMRNGKPVRNPESENFEKCDAKHDLNEKLKCWFGVLFYELVSCQTPCKTIQSQRQIEANIEIPKIQMVGEIYKRLKFTRQGKRVRNDFLWYEDMHAWERYLITLICAGHQISIEIISHVVDGCHIKAHLLDDNFGCCYGFILTKKEFMMHQFNECRFEHQINNQLSCDSGWVYHVEAPDDSPFYDDKHLGGAPRRLQRVKGTVPQTDVPNPRPPPPPAPPPPDLLDQ